MSEKEELRSAAKAIASGYKRQWLHHATPDEVCIGPWNDDDNGHDPIASVHISNYTNDPDDDVALAKYMAAANPNVVLGLFDEIATLRHQLESMYADLATYRAELARADALAETIHALRDTTTTDHESKADGGAEEHY